MIRYKTAIKRKILLNQSTILIYCIAIFLTFSVAVYHRINYLSNTNFEIQPQKVVRVVQNAAPNSVQFYKMEDTPTISKEDITPECTVAESKTDFNTFDMFSSFARRQSPKSQSGKNNYKKEKLKVFVLPFTHVDPGWLETFESYTKRTNQILTNMHQFMTKKENEAMKFMWAEFVFFERWWSLQNENVKEDVRRMVKDGRIEFSSGSWVMTDEANAYFPVSVDNIIEGMDFIYENFELKPLTIWSNDPFGYSNSVPYLFRKAGIHRNVINRIHHTLKKQLQEQMAIPFRWRQYFDEKGDDDVLTHVLPYTHYDILNSCGPDQGSCCQFDFKRLTHWNCPGPAPQNITKQNVKQKAALLVEQLKQMSQMYRSPVLLMMHGDDFRFDMIEEWHQHHDNFIPLFEEINSGKEVDISFGTFKDYFDTLESHIQQNPVSKPPTLSGDFFPYMCALGDYWTGYFTTRPFYKRQGRLLHSLIRTGDILFSTSRKTLNGSIPQEIINKMKTARRTLSLFQHHDAITGTSKVNVMDNYSQLLHQSIETVRKTIEQLTESESVQYSPSQKDVEKLKIVTEETKVIQVFNPLTFSKKEIIKIRVNSKNFVVKNQVDRLYVDAQIEPYFENGKQDPNTYLLVFLADLGALSWTEFVIEVEMNSKTTKIAKVYEKGRNIEWESKTTSISKIVLENKEIQTIHDSESGAILSLKMKKSNKEVKVEQTWNIYEQAHGGAYLMRINTAAKDLTFDGYIMITGPIRESIYQFNDKVFQQISVNRDIDEIDIKMRVDITKTRNTELMTRINTGWKNMKKYTDSVGLQLLRRDNYDLMVEANYYPMPTSAVLENGEQRITVGSNVEHGARFMNGGILEINIDRMLNQDDGKGLGSDSNSIPTDLKPVEMDFKILVENKSAEKNVYFTMHTIKGQQMIQNVIYPSLILSSKEGKRNYPPPIEFPCNVQLLTIREISNNRQLLTLFKFSSCQNEITSKCGGELQVSLHKLFDQMGVKRVQRTDLSGITSIGEIESVKNFNNFEIDSFDFLNLVLYI